MRAAAQMGECYTAGDCRRFESAPRASGGPPLEAFHGFRCGSPNKNRNSGTAKVHIRAPRGADIGG